jgi:hypothetical protein
MVDRWGAVHRAELRRARRSGKLRYSGNHL